MADQLTESVESESDVKLTDVMLAMDVVDTLRHEEALIERAMNADAREKLLTERVRKAYAAQGIDVTDAMIAEGVKALKKRQYVYESPTGGFRSRLLRAWVRRKSLGKGFGLLGFLVAVVWGGYYGFVQYPAQQALVGQVDALNAGVSVIGVDLRSVDQRRIGLQEALARADSDVPADLTQEFRKLYNSAEAHALAASRRLEEASAISLTGNFTTGDWSTRGLAGQKQLQAQKDLLVDASNSLDLLQSDIGRLERLKGLPAELSLLRDEAKALAATAALDARIDNSYSGAVSALRRGDIYAAQSGADFLKNMLLELNLTYSLQVVSRPGVDSGVIRHPDDRPQANNYYLIVEGLNAQQQAVTVQMRSEEDGELRSARIWGVRVSEALFNRVRADKQDNGIIEDRLIGSKRRGYLAPEYRDGVLGGVIFQW